MNFNEIRERLISDVHKSLPEHIERLNWSKENLTRFQTSRIREILKIAKDRSPYFIEKLKHIDSTDFKIEDLSKLPTTNKQSVMEHWDEIITVPGIKLKMAEAHLDKLREGKIDNPYYEDEYLFIATGGSSGKRGLFLWDNYFLKETSCINYRFLAERELKSNSSGPRKLAVLEAPSFLHGSRHIATVTISSDVEVLTLSSIDSADKQIKSLNEFQPTYLVGFASVISELAHYQLQGKLDIMPSWVSTNSEPLDDEMRGVIYEAWKLRACNGWGTVEIGVGAIETEQQTGLVLAEDCVLIENVDNELNPAKNISDTAKILATSLINKSFPIIRYEIDDVIDIHCDDTEYPAYRKIKNIFGRTDDWFIYPNCRIHPIAFRAVLGQVKEIEEYQIIQTNSGADIKIVCSGKIDLDLISKKISKNLISEGLTDPKLNFEVVSTLPRHPETGKVKRFIALKK